MGDSKHDSRTLFGKLFAESVFYTVGMLAGRLIALALVPVYTRHLGPEEYGLLELLDTTDQVLVVLTSAAIADAVLRHWNDARREGSLRDPTRIVSTAVLWLLGLGALVALAGVVFARPLAGLLLRDPGRASLIAMTFSTVVFQGVVEVPLAIFRGAGRPGRFVAFTLARTTLGFILNVVFVVGLRLGVAGMTLASLVSSLVVSGSLVALTLYETGLGFDRAEALTMLRFGWPLVPGALGLIALQHGRSYVLSAQLSMATVGLWGLALRLGSMMTQAVGAPLRNAWTAQMYPLWALDDGPKRFVRAITTLVALYAWGASVLIALGREAVLLVGGAAYLGAVAAVPGVVLSYALREVAELFRASLILGRDPRPVAWIEPSLALFDLALSWQFVTRWGLMGAALAAPISFALYALSLGWASQSVLKVRYALRDFARIAVTAVCFTALALGWRPAGLGWAIAGKLVLVGLGCPLAMLGWVFTRDEVRGAWGALRRRGFGW